MIDVRLNLKLICLLISLVSFYGQFSVSWLLPFLKLHIKKSTNIIFNAKFVVIEFWRNYLNKKYELLGMSLALSTLNSESKILFIPFICFEKYEKI